MVFLLLIAFCLGDNSLIKIDPFPPQFTCQAECVYANHERLIMRNLLSQWSAIQWSCYKAILISGFFTMNSGICAKGVVYLRDWDLCLTERGHLDYSNKKSTNSTSTAPLGIPYTGFENDPKRG